MLQIVHNNVPYEVLIKAVREVALNDAFLQSGTKFSGNRPF